MRDWSKFWTKKQPEWDNAPSYLIGLQAQFDWLIDRYTRKNTLMSLSAAGAGFRNLTWAAPAADSIGTSTGEILAVNSNRIGGILTNTDTTSTDRVSLGFGNAAVLDSGPTIYGSGGTYEINWTNLTVQAINGIAATASTNVGNAEAT